MIFAVQMASLGVAERHRSVWARQGVWFAFLRLRLGWEDPQRTELWGVCFAEAFRKRIAKKRLFRLQTLTANL